MTQTVISENNTKAADQTKQTQTQLFDVVIVGGGMVGASLALILQPLVEQGLRLAIVDAQAVNPNALMQPSFDARTSALSLGTQRLLERLGVWSSLSLQACPIEHIQVSQQRQFGRVHLHADELDVPAMGYVVENRHLGQALWQTLLQRTSLPYSSVEVFAPAQMRSVSVNQTGALIDVETQDGESLKLEANLLVLADGANSPGCKALGIYQTRHDYGQHAIVANIAFDQPHQNWAFERFTQQGPLALLPLTGNRYGMVWCMSPAQADELMGLDESELIAQLQKSFGYRQGRITRIGERNTYPLSLIQAEEQARPNVVVLGNAAHALHPVAGQGFNLALRDAHALGDHLKRCWPNNLGELSALKQYVQNQSQDQKLTTGLSHLLPELFTRNGEAWSLLRGAGMTAMDLFPVAKRLFAKQAMGLVGTPERWQP